MLKWYCLFFFFQAEDGIRDRNVTGVQTCALPILQRDRPAWLIELAEDPDRPTSAARGVVDRLARHGYRTFLHKERGRLVERSAREPSIDYFFLQPHHVARLKDHGVEVAERAG